MKGRIGSKWDAPSDENDALQTELREYVNNTLWRPMFSNLFLDHCKAVQMLQPEVNNLYNEVRANGHACAKF